MRLASDVFVAIRAFCQLLLLATHAQLTRSTTATYVRLNPGSPGALDETINKRLNLELSPSDSCLALTNLAVTDIGFLQIQQLPAPRHPHRY